MSPRIAAASRRSRWPMALLALVLLALVAAVWRWQAPGHKLTGAEIDRYMALTVFVAFGWWRAARHASA